MSVTTSFIILYIINYSKHAFQYIILKYNDLNACIKVDLFNTALTCCGTLSQD